MRTHLMLTSVLTLFSVPALAEPLRVTNGTLVHLVVAGKHETGRKVESTVRGWRVELDGVAADARLEASDVTNGVGPRFSLTVRKSIAELDRARFVPGHAYRLQALRGDVVTGTTLIYLQPPASRRVTTVVLDEGESDESVAVADKGLL
jgi:hypothetical protein